MPKRRDAVEGFVHAIARSVVAAVGVAHLLPAVAALSQRRVEATYDLTITDPAVALLMRHRAVLFGITGTGLLVESLRPHITHDASASALASMVSFVLLTWRASTPNMRLRKISRVDAVLIVSLLVSIPASHLTVGNAVLRETTSGATAVRRNE